MVVVVVVAVVVGVAVAVAVGIAVVVVVVVVVAAVAVVVVVVVQCAGKRGLVFDQVCTANLAILVSSFGRGQDGRASLPKTTCLTWGGGGKGRAILVILPVLPCTTCTT